MCVVFAFYSLFWINDSVIYKTVYVFYYFLFFKLDEKTVKYNLDFQVFDLTHSTVARVELFADRASKISK